MQATLRYYIAALVAFCLISIAGEVLLPDASRIRQKPEVWAAWMQAVGSIAAIWAAVVVAKEQSESLRRDRESAASTDNKRILLCLQSDLAATEIYAIRNEFPKLLDAASGTAVNIFFPIPENPFQVYNGLIPRLGTIADDELRTQLMLMYAAARGTVGTLRYNNDLLMAIKDADTAYYNNPIGPLNNLMVSARAEHKDYGDKVRESIRITVEQMASLKPMLEAALR